MTATADTISVAVLFGLSTLLKKSRIIDKGTFSVSLDLGSRALQGERPVNQCLPLLIQDKISQELIQ